MKIISADYKFEPHPSGKNTCFIATHKSTGENHFVKFPRTIDNLQAGMEEIFHEMLGENIIFSLGILEREYSLQVIDFKPAIVQPYYTKNWSNSGDEGIEIVNKNEWPLLLAAELLMGQMDRPVGKPEHVALALVEGVGLKSRAVPIDLGHAFFGAPSGSQRLDEDMNPGLPATLFWSSGDFTRAELEAAITFVESLPLYEIVYITVSKIIALGSWSEQQIDLIKSHADKLNFFLLSRRNKLRNILLAWWDQKYQSVQVPQINAVPIQPAV
jgi:hypothetical protein